MNEIERLLQETEDRLQGALAELPPVEQTGQTPDVTIAIKACKRVGQEFKTAAAKIKAMLQPELDKAILAARPAIETEVKAAMIKDSAFLKASKLITEEDHTLAVTTAVDAEKNKVTEQVNLGVAAVKQLAERRAKLVTDKVLTAVAAEALPDALLQGEDFMTGVTKIKERLAKLVPFKTLAADLAAVKRVVSFPINAEGQSEFDATLDLWTKAARPSGAAAPLNPPANGDPVAPTALF